MAVEVELKAWIDDVDSLRPLCDRLLEYRGYSVKSDIYFRSPNGVVFRLRSTERGSEVTFKRKEVRTGIEVNEEREFRLQGKDTEAREDPSASFVALIEALGCREQIRKVKRTHLYEDPADGVKIELNHVDGLGDFVEIEKLVESDAAAIVAAAEREIRAWLEKLGVGASKIEPEYYKDLLAKKQKAEGIIL